VTAIAEAEAVHARIRVHAPIDEYNRYLDRWIDDPVYRRMLRHYRDEFITRYPEIEAWFAAPLFERVGHEWLRSDVPTSQQTICHRARSYIHYLALRGYIWLDWEWLLAIARHRIWEFDERLGLSIRQDAEAMVRESVRLGYFQSTAIQVLRWTLSRLLLHAGDARVSAITDDQLDDFAAAIQRFGERSDIVSYFGSKPRYICPFQRTALLVARWSGARRDEIRRLHLDCLDTYADGTPRLRIPAGKTKRERTVPLNMEAATAIRDLQAIRSPDRGFRDDITGVVTRYLFVNHGQRLSVAYLFDHPLQIACRQTGLVDSAGRATVTAHRFRHTVGTQLAERGAKLHTIMQVLGHSSASMSMVYARISDREVLRDYQSVLGPGAVLAGPSAEILRSGGLSAEAVDWLNTNFFKTELELGHCLRLPQEGPCECDLYLSCAKFVTTKEYAPRLRARRERETQLIADAEAHNWQREVERHQTTAQRIERLLGELGEPV
jgi:integrase